MEFDQITATLKRCSGWLRDAGIDHVLVGSLAAWARGGPATCADVDFLVRPGDAERALDVLAGHGLRTERPPEGWLLKAYDGDVLVDLIFDPNGVPVEETFEHSEVMTVLSLELRVQAVDDFLATKLLSFEEHYLDFEGLLTVARALQEQADWDAVRRRTADSPYAHGFLAMVERLGLAPAAAAAPAPSRIRVSTA
jgi:hypothetical protein